MVYIYIYGIYIDISYKCSSEYKFANFSLLYI